METGRASKTALGVAIRRAAHQLMDQPPVLDDPIAVRLIGRNYRGKLGRASHPVGRDFRAFMAVRSRYAEDRLAVAVARGVRQYVVLGAGLDTFAYRNPHGALRVFEVDHPATQEEKRRMLAEAGIALPESLTFVPLDLERHTLGEDLAAAGLDAERPAFFGWLGVIPYLTRAGFRATLATIAGMPAGSGVSFDYALPPETLNSAGRTAFDALAGRVAAAGEPFQLFFTPEEMADEVRQAGFESLEQWDYEQINEVYFKDRADGLKLSAVRLAMLATCATCGGANGSLLARLDFSA
ncbi:MAG: class I SAM-dependent methyltransferase [Terracidiphilus sp.]|jgi:methyltransferase (TIGR00027 family)